jgi:tRNA pseudouridine38-40 synthase
MTTFKITLAYDGTDFVGWQRQAAGTSIQGLLEGALRDLDGRDVRVTGAGRTDAGVHALGQVAAFTLERVIAPSGLVRALNARLPRAVRVFAAAEVAASFHPRFDACAKHYRYRIWNAEVMSPFERRHAWHVACALDVDAMARAARLLVGRHDFTAFRASRSETQTSERVLLQADVTAVDSAASGPGGRLIACDITGDGFLRHMVRNIVGTLVEIGRGRRPVEWMASVLASRDRACAGPTAPPEGLFLVRVEPRTPALAAGR